MENRVVITGLGAITPIGNNVKEFWTNAKKGVCGIDEITLFDASDYKVKIAAEVKNFKAEDFIDKKEAKRLDRFTHFALAATEEAMKDAKLDLNDENVDPNRVGVIVGSGIGGYGTLEAQAYRSIKHGYSDIVISGGSEASITRAAIAGFTNLKALNTNNDPKRASIPFDKERSGFVMGEGAGILILESLESAQKRGARIYGEIIGYGATCDAYHITSPDPEGDGAKRAIEAAIEEGKINKDEISYINAHGTSTPLNDKFETLAIKGCFGEKAYDIPVSSTKSMTGHLLGAAGAIESVICVKALEEGFIPPTIGYKVPDEDCDLDYVVNEGREAELNYVINNALGFGGHNASLLFKKWD